MKFILGQFVSSVQNYEGIRWRTCVRFHLCHSLETERKGAVRAETTGQRENTAMQGVFLVCFYRKRGSPSCNREDLGHAEQTTFKAIQSDWGTKHLKFLPMSNIDCKSQSHLLFINFMIIEKDIWNSERSGNVPGKKTWQVRQGTRQALVFYNKVTQLGPAQYPSV